MHRLLAAVAAALVLSQASPAMAVKLGIVAFQMSSETQARTADAAKDAAEEKGWTVTLLNSAGSAADHARQVENLVQRRVDGIVLAMGKPLQLEPQLKAAAAAKIPVVTIMSGTSPHTLFDITVNEYELGAQIGMYLLGLMSFEGGLLMQRAEGHGGTKARGRVMDVILEENTGVKLLGQHGLARSQSGQADAKAEMEGLLVKHAGKYRAVWAALDGQAFIIDDLLQAQGLKKGQVLLTGVDGGQETFRRIRDPKSLMTATVAIPFEVMGEAAVETMADIMDGTPKEQITPGPYLFMSPVLVDATNVPEEGDWPW